MKTPCHIQRYEAHTNRDKNRNCRNVNITSEDWIQRGFHARKYARKYVTNAINARKVRNKRSRRSRRNGRSNYPQPPPLLGRLLLQFNAAQQNEF